MGIIVYRDVSSAEITTKAQTETTLDSPSPGTSDLSEGTSSLTTDTPPTETNAQPTTEPTPTIDNTTPTQEPTTREQQQTTSSEVKQTEQTENQQVNHDIPSPTEGTTQANDVYQSTPLDSALNSALQSITSSSLSSTLPTSISIPVSSSASTVIQTTSIIPCSSDLASESIQACTNDNTNNSQLSGGAIAGIVVGALVALVIVCGCLFFRKRRNSRSGVPPRQSFLFLDEKPVLESGSRPDMPSDTSVYQSQNTFGVHQNSQATIPKYDSSATTISSQITDPNKNITVATALYPPMKRNKSNEYMQPNNRMSVAADTDNYTQSAMKLFQPPSRTITPTSGRESVLSKQTDRSIYRPSLHQSQIIQEPLSSPGYLKRESTIDPYNYKKPMSLWDDNLKSEEDLSHSYNPDYEWTHDNGYIQPPIYRP